MTDEDKSQHDSEYQKLLALFMAFLKNINSDDRDEILYALMELRADLAINHAFKGFDIDVDEALLLLKTLDDNNLTKEDKDKRDRIVAAVDNLIDFAVCEEYQVSQKAQEIYNSHDDGYEIDFNDPDDIGDYTDICALYNDIYAAVENGDIEYAMSVASKWIHLPGNEYLTYWTMNDGKVRPWHLALQGYTARRDDFPSWMIPPIEWNCRCFLISSADADETNVEASIAHKVIAKIPNKPKQIGDVFSESVAKCGKIFGQSHPYFIVNENDTEFLKTCVKNLKTKYYG